MPPLFTRSTVYTPHIDRAPTAHTRARRAAAIGPRRVSRFLVRVRKPFAYLLSTMHMSRLLLIVTIVGSSATFIPVGLNCTDPDESGNPRYALRTHVCDEICDCPDCSDETEEACANNTSTTQPRLFYLNDICIDINHYIYIHYIDILFILY